MVGEKLIYRSPVILGPLTLSLPRFSLLPRFRRLAHLCQSLSIGLF